MTVYVMQEYWREKKVYHTKQCTTVQGAKHIEEVDEPPEDFELCERCDPDFENASNPKSLRYKIINGEVDL